MTDEQMQAYEQIRSIAERANFLLSIGVTAELDVEGTDLVFRACVGDMRLPVSGTTKLTAIERGKSWLEDKAKEDIGKV
ncbi:hypothetical protein MJO52_11890 [Microbulbifer variabilis]|uniref:Uncharacterized protein n=1 Tax=Microbulbifer variabilis TaxID=266805 RepID=A0ABY4V687_9GAMM|nr:hypothetical protein [Microbulbifer variabilis]USD19784.1 hypothetical protein MJO52_11890 [Microbulbifer variabilis]